MNRVRLYSNGTGVFERSYALTSGEPLHIALPIRKDSLDEAIATIGVFGDVRITEPPSYTPIGANAPNLEIDAVNVIRDMASKLRGTTVTLRVGSETAKGRLVGVQQFTERGEKAVVKRFRLALYDDGGTLRSFSDSEIRSIHFDDADVQEEIDKALQSAFETIKPNSSFLNLTLVPNGAATEAVVQYAMAQMGAWKISYRLRENEGRWRLEGQAIVDNSTDEPWEDVIISVVTGQPISFATDVADIRPVRRTRVNLVQDTALDSFEVSESLPMMAVAGKASDDFSRVGSPRRAVAAAMPGARERGTGDFGTVPARQDAAETKEIEGDVIEYTAPAPVSVGANRSAIIPMFVLELGEAQVVHIYDEGRHRSHPYRSLRFALQVGHSLARGVCTLFQDGTYVGKAILEATQPDEKRTLPYSLESGIAVHTERSGVTQRTSRVRISEGVRITEFTRTEKRMYRVNNRTPKGTRMEIEFPERLPFCRYTFTLEGGTESIVAETVQGFRTGFDLPAGAAQTLTVHVAFSSEQKVVFDDTKTLPWLLENVFTRQGSIENDPALREAIRRRQALDAAETELSKLEQQIADILDEQERLKGLLLAGGHEGAAGEWRTLLAENERQVSSLKKTRLPQLRQSAEEARTALRQSLAALTLDWPGEEEPAQAQ